VVKKRDIGCVVDKIAIQFKKNNIEEIIEPEKHYE
jgi:hypothetical protein